MYNDKNKKTEFPFIGHYKQRNTREGWPTIYPEVWINAKLVQELEIKSRIEHYKNAFVWLRNLLCDQHFNITVWRRLRVFHTEAEIWPLKVSSMYRIETFEMWTYGRMLRMCWTAHIKSIKVLHTVGKKWEMRI